MRFPQEQCDEVVRIIYCSNMNLAEDSGCTCKAVKQKMVYNLMLLFIFRGIPNYNHKKGTITFIRQSKPVVNGNDNVEVS